ncbi:MAG: hypothetical protein LBP40_05405 [Campylobacteraceae bacterium]|nr:hypothetical protein [Campylobacteraceae bacterium]
MDKSKTYIDILKSFLITLFLGLIGMESYLFINVGNLSITQLIIVAIAIVGDIIILAYALKTLFKKTNELEGI